MLLSTYYTVYQKSHKYHKYMICIIFMLIEPLCPVDGAESCWYHDENVSLVRIRVISHNRLILICSHDSL